LTSGLENLTAWILRKGSLNRNIFLPGYPPGARILDFSRPRRKSKIGGPAHILLDIAWQEESNVFIPIEEGKMKKSFASIFVFSLVFLFSLSVGCKKVEKEAAEEPSVAVDLEGAKAAVNSVINLMFESIETENIDLFSKVIAHDPDIIVFGTDAAEKLVGYEPFAETVKKEFESFEETKVTSRERVIKVHKSGEVAWASMLVDVRGKTQGQPFAVEGIRITGVCEKRDGNWVIVQWHASVPVSGQAIKY